MHQAVTTPAGAPVVPRKRRPRRKRKILIGVGAAVLLLIIAGVINSKREKPIPVTTEKAARRNILQTVSATGKVQPEVEVKISPEVAGEIRAGFQTRGRFIQQEIDFGAGIQFSASRLRGGEKHL